jgi:hypothetical protein
MGVGASKANPPRILAACPLACKQGTLYVARDRRSPHVSSIPRRWNSLPIIAAEPYSDTGNPLIRNGSPLTVEGSHGFNPVAKRSRGETAEPSGAVSSPSS